MRQNRIPCPSELVPEEPWDDTICAQCQTELPEEDPDPENDGTYPWWEGFCSRQCALQYCEDRYHEYRSKLAIDGVMP